MRFDNGACMRLYRQTIEDFCLYSGLELSESEMLKLQESAGAMSARMRAVRIISATSISKGDLEQRLIYKGEDPRQAKEAVSWMEGLNLVDDKKTAEQLVFRCITKGYGISRAKQLLYEKRIPKEFWDEVLADYPPQTERIEAYLHAHLSNEPTDKEMKKVIDALLRRGHSWEAIRVALNHYKQNADNFQEE